MSVYDMGDTDAVAVGDVIRRYRGDESQEDFAKRIGKTQRWVSSIETGNTKLTLMDARMIAEALNISLAEMAGYPDRDYDLSGEWWAILQTWTKGLEGLQAYRVAIEQDGDWLNLRAERAQPSASTRADDWHGQLRVWDREAALGWYTSSDSAARASGTMYFAIHPQGREMIGGWMGGPSPAVVVRGWATMARERERAEVLAAQTISAEGELRLWPE